MELDGSKAELIEAICCSVGADTYLSGTGARDYNDEDSFAARGVEIAYTEFQHPVYPQVAEPFVAGLSILDLLFNCGPASRDYILGK